MIFPEIFLLYFPDTKHFEEINANFRDWLVSLGGSRIYDLSDSQYDEEISKDPEGFVMKTLADPNIRIVVLDSPVARFSLELASSSTAATSPVYSTIPAQYNNDEDDSFDIQVTVEQQHKEGDEADEHNSTELEEDEEAAIRLPLSHTPAALVNPGGGANVLEATNQHYNQSHHHLPECAIQDNRYELRVFAMKIIRSRFAGKYKQLIVVRHENACDASLPSLAEPIESFNTTNNPSVQPPRQSPSSSQTFKGSSSCSENNCLLDRQGTRQVVSTSNTTAKGTADTIQLKAISEILTPHKQCLVLPMHLPVLRTWLSGHGDLYCRAEGSTNMEVC